MRGCSLIVKTLASTAVLAGLAGAAAAQTSRPASPPPPTKPAAVVNGTPILVSDLDAALNRDGPAPVELTQQQRQEQRYGALQLMIDDMLFKQFLWENAPRIDPALVTKQMTDLEGYMKKQNKTMDDYYREAHETEAQVRSNIVTKLQWQAYVSTKHSEPDLRRYYDENKDFFDGVLVRASHIVMRVAPTATEAERQAVRNKMLALRQDIVAGKIDFAEAAKKYSQCPTAPNGGDVGTFPRKGAVDEAFSRAAYTMKVGEISDVVQTEYGMHLIKVTERKPGQPSDYEKVKEHIPELIDFEIQAGIVAKMRRAAKIEINLQ